MINQEKGAVHSHHTNSDILKVIITTVSIILFNYEDGEVYYSLFRKQGVAIMVNFLKLYY